MRTRDTHAWMLAEAVDLLHSADRLNRQFFQIAPARGGPCWEPPVDMVDDGQRLTLLVALPGVAPDQFDVRIERLDRAVAEVERRVRAQTLAAEKCIADGKLDQAPALLNDAARLQLHNARLLRLIEQTEARLIRAAREILESTSEAKPA